MEWATLIAVVTAAVALPGAAYAVLQLRQARAPQIFPDIVVAGRSVIVLAVRNDEAVAIRLERVRLAAPPHWRIGIEREPGSSFDPGPLKPPDQTAVAVGLTVQPRASDSVVLAIGCTTAPFETMLAEFSLSFSVSRPTEIVIDLPLRRMLSVSSSKVTD